MNGFKIVESSLASSFPRFKLTPRKDPTFFFISSHNNQKELHHSTEAISRTPLAERSSAQPAYLTTNHVT